MATYCPPAPQTWAPLGGNRFLYPQRHERSNFNSKRCCQTDENVLFPVVFGNFFHHELQATSGAKWALRLEGPPGRGQHPRKEVCCPLGQHGIHQAQDPQPKLGGVVRGRWPAPHHRPGQSQATVSESPNPAEELVGREKPHSAYKRFLLLVGGPGGPGEGHCSAPTKKDVFFNAAR